ncbi:hypothetical protein [Methylobacter svalbardensis]|uniref:hypothetical protein n=1 Tax=Methylobacter svalbardensis TaxID=3080016 RepID=UPI0030EBC618
MPTENQSYEDTFKSGVNKVIHGIPYDSDLKNMSFIELATELAASKKDSPRFTIFEREIKKHLAKDQAKINRGNIVLGACIGLAGVFIGSFIRSSPPSNEVAPANTVQQLSNYKTPVAVAVPSAPSIVKQAIKPAPVSNNTQPGNVNP